MAWIDEREKLAKSFVGKRVEIPVHYNAWMLGARYGKVIGLSWIKMDNGDKIVTAVRVKIDNPEIKKYVKVWKIDFEYMKVL